MSPSSSSRRSQNSSNNNSAISNINLNSTPNLSEDTENMSTPELSTESSAAQAVSMRSTLTTRKAIATDDLAAEVLELQATQESLRSQYIF